MNELKIEYLDIDEIIPYENNPRNNEKSVDDVAESISKFGFKVPIILDKNNIVVAGHTRLLASKKLGLKTVPVVIADDLTENQVKAFRIADNRVSEGSEWDIRKLIAEIEGIENEFTGFDDSDIEKMLKEIEKKEEKEIKPEVDFSEELLEENNYLVLKCDNSVDWLQVETFFDLKTVKTLNSKKGYEQKGVGRVIDATEFFDKLTKKGVIE